jgi:hypothetical protein
MFALTVGIDEQVSKIRNYKEGLVGVASGNFVRIFDLKKKKVWKAIKLLGKSIQVSFLLQTRKLWLNDQDW